VLHEFDFEEDTGIDLTPLIDVIFMLLIFFVMTTTFSKPVLDIVLPSSETAEQPAERTPELVVAITSEGKIFHNEEELTRDALATLLDSREKELLNLFVDEKAPFEAFVAVVDVAKAKRGGRFVISTQSVEHPETPVERPGE
jgi:Biopolymer transport protein